MLKSFLLSGSIWIYKHADEAVFENPEQGQWAALSSAPADDILVTDVLNWEKTIHFGFPSFTSFPS